MSDQTPAERIAAARHQGLAFSWNDLSLVAKANETARAQRDLDALAEGDYVIVLCPKGERVVLDRTGDTDRLVRQRQITGDVWVQAPFTRGAISQRQAVWVDIKDGPDE